MKLTKTIGALLAAAALIFGTAGCSGGDGGGSSPNPSVNKNKDGTVTIIIQEGQNGLASCNGQLKSGDKQAATASNGKYYANFPSANSGGETAQISYVVNTDTAGDYELKIHYAFGGDGSNLRDAKVLINGEPYAIPGAVNGNLNFEYTIKDWTKWSDAAATIPLIEGDNSIVIQAAVGDTRDIIVNGNTVHGTVVSLPNIDYMSLTSPVKDPAVKLAAGASDSAYYSLNVVSEKDTFGTADASYVSLKSGSEVTITATPAAGYVFDCWHGSIGKSTFASNEATYTLTLTGDTNLKARFIPASFDKETELKGLEGYAAICDDKGTAYTVTGGFGGETITLTSVADLEANKAKISGNDPYIIKVAARITTVDNKSLAFDVGSNKTLIGETGQDYGFKNINPKISGENVIVKNLHFGDVIGDDYWGGAGNDALSIKGGKHIWIDHCEFSSSIDPKNNDGTPLSFAAYKEAGGQVDLEGESTDPETKWKKDFYDGLLDVSELSRFVSVSNCYFHDHWKACLCGGSNDKEEQRANGSLVRLTMYNNYFKNIHARQPLFRFGKAHIYSSYLYGADDASGIEVRAKSEVYVDNVYFDHFKKSVGCWNSSSGDIGAGAWKVVDCDGVAADTSSNSTSYVPPYTWTKTSAADSKANLPSSAGIE